MQHPAAFPSCRNTQRAHQRYVQQRYLAAVAVSFGDYIFRYALYGAVLTGSCPEVVLDDIVVHHFAAAVWVVFTTYNTACQLLHAGHVRILGCRVAAIKLGVGVVRTYVPAYIIGREILSACDELSLVAQQSAFAIAHRLLEVHGMMYRLSAVADNISGRSRIGDSYVVLAGAPVGQWHPYPQGVAFQRRMPGNLYCEAVADLMGRTGRIVAVVVA